MLKTLSFGVAIMLAPLLAPLVVPSIAQAQGCATAATGARCVTARPAAKPVPQAAAPAQEALVEIGEILPRGKYSMLLNATYYGLPRVRDGWVYMRIGRDVYRVDWRSHEVLELVTDQTARNFSAAMR